MNATAFLKYPLITANTPLVRRRLAAATSGGDEDS